MLKHKFKLKSNIPSRNKTIKTTMMDIWHHSYHSYHSSIITFLTYSINQNGINIAVFKKFQEIATNKDIIIKNKYP